MSRIKFKDRDWTGIQAYYNEGHSTRETELKFSLSTATRLKAVKLGLFKARTQSEASRFIKRKPISAEGRRNMSEAKKKWNRENPDKVREVFSKLSKAKSIPCEYLKEWLRAKDIQFVEEYLPMLEQGRYYSIDIALPDRKIGVEVNGDMHYRHEGGLREYYQIRHDTIEAQGWKLYEIPRKLVYNPEKMTALFNEILSSQPKQDFDFLHYTPPIKKKDRPKTPPKPRIPVYKFSWPSKEELARLVYRKSLSAIANEYGASPNTLKKYCLKHGVSYPPQGYWRRLECGYTHEEAMNPQPRILVPRHNMKPHEIEVAIDLRRNGWSFARIGKHLGFSHSCVSDTLKKEGVMGKANWARKQEMPPQNGSPAHPIVRE